MVGKAIFSLALLSLVALLVLSSNEETEKKDHKCSGDHCHAGKKTEESSEDVQVEEEDGPCNVEFPDMPSLFMWDPVEVGTMLS